MTHIPFLFEKCMVYLISAPIMLQKSITFYEEKIVYTYYSQISLSLLTDFTIIPLHHEGFTILQRNTQTKFTLDRKANEKKYFTDRLTTTKISVQSRKFGWILRKISQSGYYKKNQKNKAK
jgi:hypothetical protein